MRVKLKGDYLKQDKVTHSHGAIINIYIVYQFYGTGNNFSATLDKCLCGGVTLTKNYDTDKYKYCGCGIGFDSKGTFSHPSGGVGKNVIIFGADMNSSVNLITKQGVFLSLVKVTQGIDNTTLYAEKMYSNNFLKIAKNFV